MQKANALKALGLAGLAALAGWYAIGMSGEDPDTPSPVASEDPATLAVATPEAPAIPTTVTSADSTMPAPEALGYWLLEEFDWGDDDEVVEESLLFDPHFECRGTSAVRCSLVKVRVDGEELLARFDHHEGRLWQVEFLTPDIDPTSAKAHLPRVWRGLVGYTTRFLGQPTLARELPDLDALEVGPPQATHHWERDGIEARVDVGRRDEDLFYAGVFFSDPAGADARIAWQATVAEDDAKLRRRRARKAARDTDQEEEQPASP